MEKVTTKRLRSVLRAHPPGAGGGGGRATSVSRSAKPNIVEFANGEIRPRFAESVRGSDVFIMQTHYGVDGRSHQRLDHGAADHDRRRLPGVGQADHRRVPVLRLRPPGPQGRGSRADHGPPDRRHVQGRRRQADGLDRPALRPDPGLLRGPGRPPHGDAGARAVRAPAGADSPGDRVARRGPDQGRRAHGPAPRRLRRRPGLHLQAPPEGHGQRRRGQAR